MNLKLDELLRAVKGARTAFVGLNDMSDEELEKVHAEFKKLGTAHAVGTPIAFLLALATVIVWALSGC